MVKPGSATSARTAITAARSNLTNGEASSSISTKKPTSQLSKDAKPPPGPATISETGSEETELSTSEGEDDDTSWIAWFCGLRGNELLCEVDEDYIQDDFNLCGLQPLVSHYDHALDMILDNDNISGELDDEDHTAIENAAEMLYGLIHARYITTSKGINVMHDKYKKAEFGRCPRVFCERQPCLPVGTSDIPCTDGVKIYCPKCEDIYLPRCKYQSNMDGAYIGTTFAHLYLMSYPSSKPAKATEKYVPRVFGFKLHKDSK